MDKKENNKADYFEHLQPLLDYAKEFYDTKTVKSIMCKNAGFDPARWSQFENREKKFTSYYVYKLMKSLKITSTAQYEEITGMALKKHQKAELRRQRFMDVDQELIDKLLHADKKDREMISKALDNPDEMAVLRKLFSK